MLVPRRHTSLLHFSYTSVSSNESDMRAQAKTFMTFKAKVKAKATRPTTLKVKASSHWPQAKANAKKTQSLRLFYVDTV